ncbi:Uncharacterized protein APZ42_018659 [Daphnia magna]|uniref:Uncharacterized protein n=1 Tax=Daphnia magna TaxID=35525 RepID=A0A162CG52_9CRUS|nr:Uncharacterized protein APZ42_018659 [Daphnia magna]
MSITTLMGDLHTHKNCMMMRESRRHTRVREGQDEMSHGLADRRRIIIRRCGRECNHRHWPVIFFLFCPSVKADVKF